MGRFFGSESNRIPEIPKWVKDKHIKYWQGNNFDIHYIPQASLDENLNTPLWRTKKDRPLKVFYKKIREGKLDKKSKVLTARWILIDGRDKPKKKVPWIRVNDVWILEKLGFNPKNYLKRLKRQPHQDEYLKDILEEKEFGSRFCLNIQEVEDLKPFILSFLDIGSKRNIRLPYFAEYNYLGNAIYKQWRETETWEWFEDKFGDGQQLAGGSKSPGCVGWEPLEFWSTILTFRPVVEL